MKKLLFIIIFVIGITQFLTAQGSQNASGQEILTTIKINTSSEKPLRAPLSVDIIVMYYPENNSISVHADNINAEVIISHNGNEIDYSSSIPAVFYLPFNDGCYTITIVGGSWTAEGCLEL